MKQRSRETNLKEKTMKRNTIISAIAGGILLVFATTLMAASPFEGSLSSVAITDATGLNTPPKASFAFSQNGNIITFDASESTDVDGNILEYQWDFGDGSTGTGMIVSHTYSTTDNLSVTLTTIDDAGGIALTQTPLKSNAPNDIPTIEISSYSANIQFLTNANSAFIGGIYHGEDLLLDEISFLIRTWLGTATTDKRMYEVRVYSMAGDHLETLKATSAGVPGSAFDSEISFRDFKFYPPTTISAGDAIVLTEQSQTVDTTSFIRVYWNVQPNPLISFGTWTTSKTKNLILSNATPSIRF